MLEEVRNVRDEAASEQAVSIYDALRTAQGVLKSRQFVPYSPWRLTSAGVPYSVTARWSYLSRRPGGTHQGAIARVTAKTDVACACILGASLRRADDPEPFDRARAVRQATMRALRLDAKEGLPPSSMMLPMLWQAALDIARSLVHCRKTRPEGVNRIEYGRYWIAGGHPDGLGAAWDALQAAEKIFIAFQDCWQDTMETELFAFGFALPAIMSAWEYAADESSPWVRRVRNTLHRLAVEAGAAGATVADEWDHIHRLQHWLAR